MNTIGLGEASSRPATAARAHGTRPHVFADGRCTRCQMLSSWPGARYLCEGNEYSGRVQCTHEGCKRVSVHGGKCGVHRGRP